jgi:hypothetical protein
MPGYKFLRFNCPNVTDLSRIDLMIEFNDIKIKEKNKNRSSGYYLLNNKNNHLLGANQ